MSDSTPSFDRVTLASSALLSPRRGELLAAADLGYFRGYWSRWIAEEMVRASTTLIIQQAEEEGISKQELKRRLERSSELINAYWDYCAQLLTTVEVTERVLPDLVWLEDETDRRTVRTAMAVGTPSTLVTENPGAFSAGDLPVEITILRSDDFLKALYQVHSDAMVKVAEYLAKDYPGGPRGGTRLGIVPPPGDQRPGRRPRSVPDGGT